MESTRRGLEGRAGERVRKDRSPKDQKEQALYATVTTDDGTKKQEAFLCLLRGTLLLFLGRIIKRTRTLGNSSNAADGMRL